MAKVNVDRSPAKSEPPRQLKTPAYVQYVGLSDRRGLTQKDFALAGVEHPSLWWDKENDWKVPLSEISDAAYSAGIERDSELILVEGEPQEIEGEG